MTMLFHVLEPLGVKFLNNINIYRRRFRPQWSFAGGGLWLISLDHRRNRRLRR